MSAPRDTRTVPKARFSVPPKAKELEALGFTEGTLKERRKALMKSLYEHELPGGYRSQVDTVEDISGGHGSFYIEGTIRTRTGKVVGSFERKVEEASEWYDARHTEESEYGPGYENLKTIDGVQIDHTSFRLDDEAQASNIGSAFIKAGVDKYRELGVNSVTVYAGDEVGGYAWAREGFRIENGQRNRNPFSTGPQFGTRHEEMESIFNHADEKLARLHMDRKLTDEQHAQAFREIKALKAASEQGEDVQPIHIASVGESTSKFRGETTQGGFYDTWPGKEMMLGASWQGTYYFDATALRAAAGSHFNPGQPRDKDGKWTAYRAGITSLAQNTLDRAIQHGMDGIFGQSPTGGTPWPRAPRLKGQPMYDQAKVTEALRNPPRLSQVDPRMLYSTQPGLTRHAVEYYRGDTYRKTGRPFADQENAGNQFPVVYVNKRGQQILLSGHHRAAADLVEGRMLDAILVVE